MINILSNFIKNKFLISGSIIGMMFFSGCTNLYNTNDTYSIHNSFQEIYKGHYYCLQGKTSLVLSINYKENNKLDAIFDFQFSENIYGTFNMNGFQNKKDNTVYLIGNSWISKIPTNYRTVDLVGKFDESGNLFSGKVVGHRCTTFSLIKVN